MLTVLRPVDSGPGWVYVYQRTEDIKKLSAGRITNILLHKIGYSKHEPDSRVKL